MSEKKLSLEEKGWTKIGNILRPPKSAVICDGKGDIWTKPLGGRKKKMEVKHDGENI